jgi:hypothetical protein
VKRRNNKATDYFEELDILYSSDTEICDIFRVNNKLEPAIERRLIPNHVATAEWL